MHLFKSDGDIQKGLFLFCACVVYEMAHGKAMNTPYGHVSRGNQGLLHHLPFWTKKMAIDEVSLCICLSLSGIVSS